ncbi:hypothetical protein NUW54_g10468 [Trametes sanguinea]|uniref:Uncharacterized protein n=1 Tax=Trametes sanguinea TaxID=158606 RepID=A0ACC1P1I3_9APHY|nr:hypothetical protein NUW54_g10468 [Trametes sanguinea]
MLFDACIPPVDAYHEPYQDHPASNDSEPYPRYSALTRCQDTCTPTVRTHVWRQQRCAHTDAKRQALWMTVAHLRLPSAAATRSGARARRRRGAPSRAGAGTSAARRSLASSRWGSTGCIGEKGWDTNGLPTFDVMHDRRAPPLPHHLRPVPVAQARRRHRPLAQTAPLVPVVAPLIQRRRLRHLKLPGHVHVHARDVLVLHKPTLPPLLPRTGSDGEKEPRIGKEDGGRNRSLRRDNRRDGPAERIREWLPGRWLEARRIHLP